MRFCLLLSLFIWGSSCAVFPSIMEGEYTIENFYTVELMVGTPPRSMRLAVDFSSTGVTTSLPIPLLSRSFSPALGGSDIIHFEDNNIRVPLTMDGGAKAASLGCSDCEGAIGIGAGSNMWLYYQKGIFTAGSTLLDESLRAYSNQISGEGQFTCLAGVPNLCLTDLSVRLTTGFNRDLSVGRITGIVRIDFGYPVAKTVVPPYIYHAFTQGRNVQKNPDPDEWPDLEFSIPSITGTGDDNKFTIRSQDIIVISRRTGFDLLLEPGTDNFTVVLSRSAGRSFLLKRDWHDGTAQVVSWCAKKHWSAFSLSMMIVGSVLFVYWKVSPSAEWKAQGQAPTFGPLWKMLASFAGAVLLIVTYALPGTQNAFKSHLDFNIYVGAFIGNMVLWQLFGACLYLFGGSKRLLGYHALPITLPDVNEAFSIIGSSINPPYTEDGRFPSAYPASSKIPQRYVYITPRLWIVIGLANESVLLLLLFLVFIETRVETLGTFFTVLLIFLLLFNIVYYMMIAFFVNTRAEIDQPYLKTTVSGMRRKSVRWSFTWMLFWTSVVTLLIAGLILAQIHVVQPFVERHVTRFPRLIVYTTVFAYGAGLLLALSWARQRVIYEEQTKFKLIQKYIKSQ